MSMQLQNDHSSNLCRQFREIPMVMMLEYKQISDTNRLCPTTTTFNGRNDTIELSLPSQANIPSIMLISFNARHNLRPQTNGRSLSTQTI